MRTIGTTVALAAMVTLAGCSGTTAEDAVESFAQDNATSAFSETYAPCADLVDGEPIPADDRFVSPIDGGPDVSCMDEAAAVFPAARGQCDGREVTFSTMPGWAWVDEGVFYAGEPPCDPFAFAEG